MTALDQSSPASSSSELEVVLVAHGEAESAGFFENFRVGHRTLAHSAEVMRLPAPLRWMICTLGAARKRFRRASGSPHNAWTRAQAAALTRKLEPELGESVTVRAAFASSEPSVEALIKRPGVAERRVFVSMMPSDSRLACGLVCHALARTGVQSTRVQVLARLWDDPAFMKLNAAHVRAACAAWTPGPDPERSQTPLVLALHGTLVRDLRGRRPDFHAGLVEKSRFAAALQAELEAGPDSPWTEVVPAYLNHDVGGHWTQPTVAAVLEDLHRRGFDRAWVFPCDYLVEGIEITGGLAATLAAGPVADARLLPCLNDSPDFIDYLAERIQRALKHPEGRWRCDPCPLGQVR